MHLQSLFPAALLALSAIFSTTAPAAADSAIVAERSSIASGENATRRAPRDLVRVAATKTDAAKTENSSADGAARGGEMDEAEVVIEDSRKNLKVTHKDFADCMKDWGPQTQMTKAEWAASCRSTLEYFPAAP